MLGLRHSTTYGFKDLRAAEFRDQQPECVSLRGRLGSHVAARPGAPVDDTGELQFAQRAIHSGTGRAETKYQFRLTRQALPRAVLTGNNGISKESANHRVFRERDREHNLIIQIRRCPDNRLPLTMKPSEGIFPSAFIVVDSAICKDRLTVLIAQPDACRSDWSMWREDIFLSLFLFFRQGLC